MKKRLFIAVLLFSLSFSGCTAAFQDVTPTPAATETAPTAAPVTTAPVNPAATDVPVTTNAPEPTATPVPEPTATIVPEPTATTAPEPAVTPEPTAASPVQRADAVYLGVSGHGTDRVNKDNIEDFQYRFEINKEEKTFSIKGSTPRTGEGYDLPVQNSLKEGYLFEIEYLENEIISVTEKEPMDSFSFVPPVSGTPGTKTVKNFLTTAFMPAGTTLYIYGGGWDWEDEGSSVSCRSLGISDDWVRFFNENDGRFTYRDFYPYGGYNEYWYAGLDCSGYIGWCLYNTFETENGKEGFVGSSTSFAKRLSERGFGSFSQKVSVPDGKNKKASVKPGDIMSINGHVWISLGSCDDGSVLILHSSPTSSRDGFPGGGVQLSAIGTSIACEAYQLADRVMKTYYPSWYERYPVSLMSADTYFRFTGDTAGLFSWDTGAASGLSDPEGITFMKPENVIKSIFNEQSY
ncbi:MAG: hypothetical protein J6Z46_09815 [Lachnospiraceae bacterium]|nr:hypothetical protein [Lachnospiraceae bacterium]